MNVQYDAVNMNVKAYAVLGEDKRLSVTLINKEASRDVEVGIVGTRAFGSSLRLAAPSLESKGEVTLGGAAVAADGQWAANRREQLATPRGKCVIEVPAASAAFVTLVG